MLTMLVLLAAYGALGSLLLLASFLIVRPASKDRDRDRANLFGIGLVVAVVGTAIVRASMSGVHLVA